jgi:hypothetical protein
VGRPLIRNALSARNYGRRYLPDEGPRNGEVHDTVLEPVDPGEPRAVDAGQWTRGDGRRAYTQHGSGDGRIHTIDEVRPGADTTPFGGKSHGYPEEVFIVSGRLYDQAFDLWLEAGHYASRPPGEVHGPFKTELGCIVLELSFPMRGAGNGDA